VKSLPKPVTTPLTESSISYRKDSISEYDSEPPLELPLHNEFEVTQSTASSTDNSPRRLQMEILQGKAFLEELFSAQELQVFDRSSELYLLIVFSLDLFRHFES
jgi:hypothetical protein